MQDKPCKIVKGGGELEAAPPISVTRFLQIAGISQVTFWRWEGRGLISTVRIAGRKYIPARVMAEFNRRMEAGDFAGKTQNPHDMAAAR
jgi:hypothetical protein